ncbi:MAG: ABC transporter permease subunit [Acidimicrobiia bacterium]|nr:ABC transporter permease subunit [Acidimicrobiia bacterium]
MSLGIILGRFRIADTFLDPILTGLFMLPKLALLPIVALWLGYQEPAKIVYIFLFGFFEVLFTVRSGVRAMEAEFVEVARLYAVPEAGHVAIDHPAGLVAVRRDRAPARPAPRDRGGGHRRVPPGVETESGGLIFNAGVSFQPEILFAGLATVAVVGISINVALHAMERRVAP